MSQENFEITGKFSRPHTNGGYYTYQNPQIEIITTKVPTTQLRMTFKIEDDNPTLIFFVFHMAEGTGRRTFFESHRLAESDYVTDSNTCSLSREVSPGRYIAVLCSCKKERKDACYRFTVEKNEGVKSVLYVPEYPRKIIEGTWGDFEGGLHKIGKNPQYIFRVKCPCEIRFSLEMPDSGFQIGIAIGEAPQGTTTRLKRYKSIVYSQAWQNQSFITHKFVDSNIDYIISPTRTLKRKGKYMLLMECEIPNFFESFEELKPGENTEYAFLEENCQDIIDKYKDPENPPFLKDNPCEELLERLKEIQKDNPKRKVVFNDKDFPASMKSISTNSNDWSQIYVDWKRPREYLDNPDLFVDGIDPDDFIQGKIGDCWLISSLSVYCRDKETAEDRIFPNHFNSFGFYVFKFVQNHVWKYIIVDDQIPISTMTNSPIYGHSREENEMYVGLMEKAFAKIYKSYYSLNGNTMANAFFYFGGEFEKIDFRSDDINKIIKEDELWKKIMEYSDKKWLMGTSFLPNDLIGKYSKYRGGRNLMKQYFGLEASHAYSILSAIELSGGIRLLRLRNPWGKGEWNGDFSDDSPLWTKERKLACPDYVNKNDGAFFIPLDDFLLIFPEILFHCSKNYIMDHRFEFKGDYITDHNNPKRNCFPCFSLKNPKIQIHVKEDDTKCIFSYSVITRDGKKPPDSTTMTMVLGYGKIEDLDLKKRWIGEPGGKYEINMNYNIMDSSLQTSKIIPKGVYYFIGGAQIDDSSLFSYTYKIRASKDISCIPDNNNKEQEKKMVIKRGKFTYGHWLSYKNPKIDILLKDKTSSITNLEILWKRTDKKEIFGQYPLILKQDCPRDDSNFQIIPGLHSFPEYIGLYSVSNESSLSVAFPFSEKPFTFYVSGAKKFAGLKYELIIKSDKEFEVSEVYF